MTFEWPGWPATSPILRELQLAWLENWPAAADIYSSRVVQPHEYFLLDERGLTQMPPRQTPQEMIDGMPMFRTYATT